MARKRWQTYPDFSAELEYLQENGGAITPEILSRMIRKHRGNSQYNHRLCERYACVEESVPIFSRHPRFSAGVGDAALNNKLNHDFFSEIVDFKTGYFAGNPISYSYSKTQEAQADSGNTDEIAHTLSDFQARSNLYDVDLQCTKYAAICGYSARLFYIDQTAQESVMPVFPYQAAILSTTGRIEQPSYGVRYYRTRNLNDQWECRAEFYNASEVVFFKGGSFDALTETDRKLHGFQHCPLQGIPNNEEMTGDAECVLSLIDAYDRCMSDCSNEIENFAQAYLVFQNIPITDEQMAQAQRSGTIQLWTGSSSNANAFYLTKDINDTFVQNYCNRLEDNIFHRSKTPNLQDETFGTASGVSLKFKLLELETKCGMLQAKVQAAGAYMFRLLSDSWNQRLTLGARPEHFVMDFSRNFPLDALSEAQAAEAMLASGLPKEVVYSNAYSFVDDVDYVMELIAKEEGDTDALYYPDTIEEGEPDGE